VTSAALPDARANEYYAIAHRAGNNLHDLEHALAVGVDAIECDFWHDHGRLTLRHERKLPVLPVLYDKWHLRFAWGELSLPALLREINFRAELFLDIKSATPKAASVVLDLYHDNEAMMPRTIVSSPQWRLLDQLAAAGTEMRMCYSVKNAAGIDALFRRCERDLPPAGTSMRHTLLSEVLVARLHAAGLKIYAWTVNTRHRAQELRAWGVDGIISDDLSVLSRAAHG